MWNEPSKLQLKQLPSLYSTEDQPAAETMIHMHFFLGSCDWYMAEYSPTDRIFFCYAILNNDHQNAEWGYSSFDELRDLRIKNILEIDRDLHFRPRTASEVERIVESYEARGHSIVD